jgi:hypothetical protein
MHANRERFVTDQATHTLAGPPELRTLYFMPSAGYRDRDNRTLFKLLVKISFLKEESDFRNERDVVPAGIRAGPNPQN